LDTRSRIQSDSDGLFDRRTRPIGTIEKKRFGGRKRRLGQKTRARASMRLRCVHQKRMA
jgi:hypothetical protein